MERRAISLAYSELHDKAGMAKMADDAGFAIIFNSGESIPVFGAMAALTSRSKIGSGVIHGFGHEPRNLARHCADLQAISDNRFILGLGGGTKRMNINIFGEEITHPASRLRDLIKSMREVWGTPAGSRAEYEGAYYRFITNGTAGERAGGAVVGQTPVYLAAVNRSMFRLAGELCDGLCGHPIASVPFIEKVVWPEIDEGLRRAGRERSSFDHATWIVTAISNDRSMALRELKYHVGRFMATRSYGIVLDSQGLSDVKLKIQEAFFGKPNDVDALVAAVPDEVAAAHGIYGTPDEVRHQFRRYVGVVDTPTLYCASACMSKERVKENLLLMIETFAQ